MHLFLFVLTVWIWGYDGLSAASLIDPMAVDPLQAIADGGSSVPPPPPWP